MVNKDEFLTRFDNAKGKWEQWRGLHQDAYDYALPQRNLFTTSGNPINYGERRNLHLYDNTAVDSVAIFASRMLQMIAPVGKHWFKFEISELMKKSMIEDERMDEDEIKEEQKVLDDLTDIFFHYWENSNGANQLHEAFHDLAVGTSAVLTNETDDEHTPFVLSSVPLYQIAIEEGTYGNVDTVFRDHYIPFKSILAMWPNANLSERTLSNIKNNPSDKIRAIEGVVYSPKEKKYQYMVVIKDTQEEIVNEMFLSNPWAVSRYKLVAGETYGRGPVIDLLPDIKMVNKASEFVMRAAEKASSEIFLGVEDGVLNPDIGLTLEPDSLVFVDNIENFSRLPFQGRPDITQAFLQERQFNIKKKLLADSIDRPKALSPEEIQALNSEKLFDTNATFTRLTSEMLEPIIMRIVDILQRKGKIGDFKFDKSIMTIKYTSPLAQLQNLQDSQLLLSTVSQIDNTLGIDKSEVVLDKMAIATQVAKNSNIDATFIRTAKEQNALIEQQQQEAQAAQAAELAAQQGQ